MRATPTNYGNVAKPLARQRTTVIDTESPLGTPLSPMSSAQKTAGVELGEVAEYSDENIDA